MGHKEADTIKELRSESVNFLYTANCVNRSGKTTDTATARLYTEVISEDLLKRKSLDKSKIKVVPRSRYKSPSHTSNKKIKPTIRKEEIFAKKLNGKNLGELGLIIDYQIPLRAPKNDASAGKIDLISLKGNVPYIIELKYINNKETLLRAALEIWTYYQQLHKKNFISSFAKYKKSQPANIRKALLLVVGCKAYEEALELKCNPGSRKYLKKLIKKMDVDIFLLDNLTKISCSS